MKIAPQTHRKLASSSKVVGEEYYPLGHTNFNSLINKIKVAKPDCIYAAVVGGSNVAFYKQLKAAGVTADKQFLLTISVTEDEVLRHRRREHRRLLRVHEVLPVAGQPQQQGSLSMRSRSKFGEQGRDRRRDAGRLPRPVAVESRGGEGRQLRCRQGRRGLAGHRVEDRPEGYVKVRRRTITCGARRASGRRSSTASSRWWPRSPAPDSSPIRSRRAISRARRRLPHPRVPSIRREVRSR